MTRPTAGAWAWTGIALALGLPALPGLWPEHAWPADWSLHTAAGLHQDLFSFWTCAWVHANTPHLLANLAGLGLILSLGWILRPAPQAAIAWAMAWPLTHLTLLLDPRLDTYYGLSGVLHAGVSILAVSLITQPRPEGRRARIHGGLLLAGLFAKCWLENPNWLALVPRPELQMNAAPLSHWAGALAGVVTGLLLTKCHRCSKSRP